MLTTTMVIHVMKKMTPICEGDGDEEEGIGIDIGGKPLFIDELTQRAKAQKRKKSIRTGSYPQDEDKLICQCWMEISQDPRTGAQQKGPCFLDKSPQNIP